MKNTNLVPNNFKLVSMVLNLKAQLYDAHKIVLKTQSVSYAIALKQTTAMECCQIENNRKWMYPNPAFFHLKATYVEKKRNMEHKKTYNIATCCCQRTSATTTTTPKPEHNPPNLLEATRLKLSSLSFSLLYIDDARGRLNFESTCHAECPSHFSTSEPESEKKKKLKKKLKNQVWATSCIDANRTNAYTYEYEYIHS